MTDMICLIKFSETFDSNKYFRPLIEEARQDFS